MKQPLTAMIVDDERLARNEMRSLLSRHPEIELIGEASNVSEARSVIENQSPQVVFLDIRLGRESGFELLDSLKSKSKVIFVTAFDEYAVRAFEVNALDYLLKPVNPARLEKAIRRLFQQEEAPLRALEYEDRLFLRVDEKSQFLKVGEIRMIRSAGDYSELVFAEGKTTLVLKPLIEWERRLPPKHFLRIHRSTIVNLEYVQNVDEWFHHSYRICLQGISKPLPVSRRYAVKLKERYL